MAGILSTGLLALAAVANALPQGSTGSGSSCQQLGSGTKQGAYTIKCGTDRVGGDLSNAQSSSFSGCIPLCDALADCIGFTYVQGSSFCYFKSSFAAESTDPNVDVAVKPVASSPSSSASGSAGPTGTATSTAAPATSDTATSTSAAPSSTAAGSCDAIGNGNTFGNGYTATCRTDASGGDLSNAQVSSFAGCAPVCDSAPECIGFSYFNGHCYLKRSQNSFASNDHVDVAFKPASSSSTTAPSTTATTTTTMSSSSASTPSSSAPATTTTTKTSSSASPSSTSTSASSSIPPAPAPSGVIVSPAPPAGSENDFCPNLRQAFHFKLATVVTRGNAALDGLFLQSPSYTASISPPRLVSGYANGGRYVQTNSNNWFNIAPAIASVTSSGTCSTTGLALYDSGSEQGAVGLVPNLATSSTVDILTTVNYILPFSTFKFGSFYACPAPGGAATLRWVKANGSNYFGSRYNTLDLNNCALVTLQKIL